MKFRFAVPEDCETILSFIRHLALYEHMEDQVVADEALLREWIFEKGKAEVLFALDGETPVASPFSSTTSPPSWAGPVSIWRIFSYCRNTGAKATARVF